MPDVELKDSGTKVIMIIGVSKAARATTMKLVERGNTVVLVATSEHQAYLDEMGSKITEMGGSSLTMGIDPNNLLEVQAMFEATTTQYKNVNSCLHFSKGLGKINPEVLEFLQDKINPVTGTTTCTMTDKWISKQALDEMGQSVLPEEVRFPDFVTQRVLGIREFEQRETYHLIDKDADAKREAEAEKKVAEAKQAETKAAEQKKDLPIHVASPPAKKGAPPPSRPAPPPPAAATPVPNTPSTPAANKPIPGPSGTVKKAPPPPSATVEPSTSPNFCKSCKRVGNAGNWCNFCGQRR